MKSELSESFFLSAGETNAEDEMSLPLLVSKLIDIATAHANSLGIGNPDMPDPDTGWVLSRLTIEMTEYPAVNTEYTITTWVEDWNRHFSIRCFCISDSDGKPLGYARSVWMVLNTRTRANAGLGKLNFDKSLISTRPCPIERQAKHISIQSQDADTYRFRYSDLDHYRHVNTVRYVSLLLNQFSLEKHDREMTGRLELSFLHEARYDMEVKINREMRKDDDAEIYSFFLEDMSEDKTPVLYARLFFRPRLRLS